MPLYLIERRFAEQLDLSGEDVDLIEAANAAEGVRWLLGHRVLRTICWLLALENVVEMAGFAMLVLLAQDVLGLGAGGYGLLLACLAVGAIGTFAPALVVAALLLGVLIAVIVSDQVSAASARG